MASSGQSAFGERTEGPTWPAFLPVAGSRINAVMPIGLRFTENGIAYSPGCPHLPPREAPVAAGWIVSSALKRQRLFLLPVD
jgi:hypothetical protein